MNAKIREAIDLQIQAEFNAAYMYLGMAAYLDEQNLSGMAAWMKAQSQEEIRHGMKFYNFLQARQVKVTLGTLAAPKTDFPSVRAVFENSFEHEKSVTKMIYRLYELAEKEKDHSFSAFLKWFLDEQVEEESSVTAVIEKLKLLGDSGPHLYFLDQELGKRSNPES